MIFQCYFEDETIKNLNERRCKNDADPELEYWCSEEHKRIWQEKNYGNSRANKKKLSIPEMQERLLEMGRKENLEPGGMD